MNYEPGKAACLRDKPALRNDKGRGICIGVGFELEWCWNSAAVNRSLRSVKCLVIPQPGYRAENLSFLPLERALAEIKERWVGQQSET